MAPLVSIVMVTYNALEYVRQSVDGILSRTSAPFELIVVDNASEEPTRDYLRSVEGIRLLENPQNLLWCQGCNIGASAAHPESRYLLLVNSDIEILRDDWVEVMAAVMESEPQVAIVGPQLNRRQPYAPVYGWIDGHCMLIRHAVWKEIGGFDARRWPWTGAPMEFTAAAFARGWTYKVLHPRDRLLVHHEEKSKSPGIRQVLAALPKPKSEFHDTLVRYGLEPRLEPVDRYRLLRPLRSFVDRRRFYYAEPVGDESHGSRAASRRQALVISE